MQIILASTSLYRGRLLQRLGLAFEQIDPGIDEESWKTSGFAPEQLALRLAQEKANAVSVAYPDALVIAGDQVLEFEGTSLGKPETRENNIAQLVRLSGTRHQLLTAVCLRKHEIARCFVNRTTLCMRTLTRTKIEHYVDYDRAFDCAGGYKIESLGISLFSEIDSTDFTAIEGLPLIELAEHLREFGLKIP
jgi:7-methyl-GTP pyrophosphatase